MRRTVSDPRLMLCPAWSSGLLGCTGYHRHEQELMNVSDDCRPRDMMIPRSHRHATSMDGALGAVSACVEDMADLDAVEGPNAGSLWP